MTRSTPTTPPPRYKQARSPSLRRSPSKLGVGVNKKKVVGTGKTKKKVSTKIVKKVNSNLGRAGGSAKKPTRQKMKETAPTPAVVEEVEEEKRDDDSDDGMGEGDGAICRGQC